MVPSPAISRSRFSRETVILLIVLLVASALRIPGLFTDFWFDEIWSWNIAGQLHGVIDILRAEPAHIDNNHPLNTLWLYLLGQNRAAWLYRIPPLFAGVGSVILATGIMRRKGNVEATIAAILFSFNFPLIFYSSEARGYSLAVFFALLAFLLLERALTKTCGWTELFFGLTVCLGELSHLTFLHIYAGAIVWSAVQVMRIERTTFSRLIRLVRLHAIPLIFTELLLRFFARDMVIGGAAPTSAGGILVQTLSLTIGGSGTAPYAIVTAVFTSVLVILAMNHLRRAGSNDWIFFLVAIVISPAIACARDLFLSERPQPLMLRYFLVCVATGLLCVASLLANLWRENLRWRLAVVLFLVLYCIGNLWHFGRFLQTGRGGYSKALSQIAERSAAGAIEISSDYPERTQMIADFYAIHLRPNRRIVISGNPREWLIVNRLEPTAPLAFSFANQPYDLQLVYEGGELSGWTWAVYRRAGSETVPQQR